MRLVIDASTLVAGVMRLRGRELLATPSLDLVVAAEAWAEAEQELRKRIGLSAERRRVERGLSGRMEAEVAASKTAHVRLIAPDVYADRLAEAAWRIPRDPRDIPTVSLALALDGGIWTNDRDFFGCGLPVGATDVLPHYLEQTSVERERDPPQK